MPVLLAFNTRRKAIQERRIVERLCLVSLKRRGMENGGGVTMGEKRLIALYITKNCIFQSEESWALWWVFISIFRVAYGRIYSLERRIWTIFMGCSNSKRIL